MAQKCAHRQLGGLAVDILAMILCITSLSLPQWRVWCLQDPTDSKPSMILVWMWKTCIYRQKENSDIFRVCHQYSNKDILIPLDIRIAQHLLLISSFLGLVAIISVIVALWKLYSGRFRKKKTYNPFKLPGSLNIVASSFVFLSILYNYLSIIRKDGSSFPESFHSPSLPDTQKVSIALALATLSCFLFLVGGIISLTFTFRQRHQIHYSNI